jgi:hypothetical protein
VRYRRGPAGALILGLVPAPTCRHEVAEFLRHHREATCPEAVGLPVNGNRRAPGLPREERRAEYDQDDEDEGPEEMHEALDRITELRGLLDDLAIGICARTVARCEDDHEDLRASRAYNRYGKVVPEALAPAVAQLDE